MVTWFRFRMHQLKRKLQGHVTVKHTHTHTHTQGHTGESDVMYFLTSTFKQQVDVVTWIRSSYQSEAERTERRDEFRNNHTLYITAREDQRASTINTPKS